MYFFAHKKITYRLAKALIKDYMSYCGNSQ